MDSKTRSGGFARVSRTNSLLRRSDAGTTKFDLFQSVYDLMEVKDEVCPVGDEETSVAIETCIYIQI